MKIPKGGKSTLEDGWGGGGVSYRAVFNLQGLKSPRGGGRTKFPRGANDHPPQMKPYMYVR